MPNTDLLIFIGLCCAWMAGVAYVALRSMDKAEIQRRDIIARLISIEHRVNGIDRRGHQNDMRLSSNRPGTKSWFSETYGTDDDE